MILKNRGEVYLSVLFIALITGLIMTKLHNDHLNIWEGVGNNMAHITKTQENISRIEEEVFVMGGKLDDLYKD